MAPLPKKPTDHFIFIHPGHALTSIDGDQEYLCHGCKTVGGAGKRFRCSRGCDFDLHDYCATCPRHLTSFMHKTHALELMMRKGQSQRVHHRVCHICNESVEGLFYRCEACEFDVHPLCTQLPEKLHHALHKTHPLTLQSSNAAGSCAVCQSPCGSAMWRYRCGDCNFDIHLECILVPVVSCQKKGPPETNHHLGAPPPVFDQGIPFQPPPQFAPYSYYYYGFPYHGPGYVNHPSFNHGYPYNMHPSMMPQNYHGPGYVNHPGFNHGYQFNMHQNMMPLNYHDPGCVNHLGFNHGYPFNMHPNMMPQNYQVGASGSNGGAGRIGKSMFAIVGQLGFGVVSNMIFGVDLTSLFQGFGC